MSSSLVFVTYHPAAVLHAGKKKAGEKGPSKDAIIQAIREDLRRVRGYLNGAIRIQTALDPSKDTTVNATTVDAINTSDPKGSDPSKALPVGTIAIDTEYDSRNKALLTVSTYCSTTGITWDYTGEPLAGSPLLDTPHTLAIHNAPEDVALLWEHGLIPKDEAYPSGRAVLDTYVVARMNHEDRPSFELENLLASRLTMKSWKSKTRGKDPTLWTPEERRDRCGRDAWAHYKLAEAEWPRLAVSSKDLELYEFTSALNMALHRLSLAGAFIDVNDWSRIKKQIEQDQVRRLATLNSAATLLGMQEFDPDNDNHIREMLFERGGFPVLEQTKKTKQPAATKIVLEMLGETAEGGAKELLKLLLEYGAVSKQHSTYLLPIEEKACFLNLEGIGDTAWLSYSFNVLGAKTGRRSSSDPNMQNWPKAMRRLVRSRYKDGVILELDYRKLEPRIIAWLAKDDKLLHYFVEGGGYIDVARDLFKTEIDEKSDLYRGVKSVVLGVHYDMGTDEMAYQLWTKRIRFGKSYDDHWIETDRLRNLYLERFPSIGHYMDRRRNEARTTGAVRTPTGRLRRVGSEFVDKHVLNQAINSPVQSTAGDITGTAILEIEANFLTTFSLEMATWYDMLLTQRRRYLTARQNGSIMGGVVELNYRMPALFNEVHDALLADSPPEHVKITEEIMVEGMRSVPLLREMAPYLKRLPLDVDVKKGPKWGL